MGGAVVKREEVVCPNCGSVVEAINHRYATHHAGAVVCLMSGMPQPVEGYDYAAMSERARIVASLADEVQHADAHEVWRYLCVMPAGFVRELLQVALAGLDVEGKRVSEIWKEWDVS